MKNRFLSVKTFILCFMAFLMASIIPDNVFAAESYVPGGNSIQNASALDIHNTDGYYSTTDGSDAYFYFTTPSDCQGFTNLY